MAGFHKQLNKTVMAFDYTPKIDVIRQNQTQNVRELLKAKGWIGYISTYEFMGYVELWTDYCLNGPTKDNKQRFKDFDSLIQERITDTKMIVEQEIDGILLK